MNYFTDLIKKNTKRRPFKELSDVKFIVAHDTGNASSTARDNVNYYKNTANQSYSSAHMFVDDKEAVMCIPAFEDKEVAYHVGGSSSDIDNDLYGIDSNYGAIGVEMCYFPSNHERTLRAYRNYIKVLVDLFIFHKISPDELVGHFQLSRFRTDPNNALQYIDKNFANLKADVRTEYERRMKYKDVSEWAMEAWLWAEERGINDGEGAKNTVTEEQVMVFLKRYHDSLKVEIK